jgi:hypothetical protein
LSSSNLDSMEIHKNLVIFSGWFQTCSTYFSCCWVANSWLCNVPSLKNMMEWKSMGLGWHPIYEMENNPNGWDHQPDSCFHTTSWNKGIFVHCVGEVLLRKPTSRFPNLEDSSYLYWSPKRSCQILPK